LLSGLALVTSAAGTIPTQRPIVRHLPVAVAALAIDGDRVAFDTSSWLTSKPGVNKVLVWNVRTGKTVRVSGRVTAGADGTSTGVGVFGLALANSRVAWLVNEGGNLEGDDLLFTSSVTKPRERKVASATRLGNNCPGRETSNCAGPWLGGLVGSGNLIAVNRWTTDATGALTAGQLDVLGGTKLKQVATATGTVQAVAADGGRVAVLHADGTVAMYSATGKLLRTLDAPPDAEAVALSGKNLLVATKSRQLDLYNARTGSLHETIIAGGVRQPHNLDVQGNIAIYTTPAELVLHAVNLSTGKDLVIAEPHGGVSLARIDAAGVVYTDNGFATKFGKGRLVFMPFSRVKAAVG
jgi:hypothetical protein